jgi:hypothetical protein
VGFSLHLEINFLAAITIINSRDSRRQELIWWREEERFTQQPINAAGQRWTFLFIKTTVDISLDSQNLHHHDRNRGVRDVYRSSGATTKKKKPGAGGCLYDGWDPLSWLMGSYYLLLITTESPSESMKGNEIPSVETASYFIKDLPLSRHQARLVNTWRLSRSFIKYQAVLLLHPGISSYGWPLNQ